MSASGSSNTIIAVIILAAGPSSRLGRPKQLLAFKGSTLVRHVVSMALQSCADPVIVVTGAGHEAVAAALPADSKIRLVENREWREGIAASIRAGIRSLPDAGISADAAILAVCDQPDISAQLLNELVDVWMASGKPIVASSYAGTMGTPVLFDKSLFPALLALQGDTGAKKIIFQHPQQVATVNFPQGFFDIDTPEQYEALKGI